MVNATAAADKSKFIAEYRAAYKAMLGYTLNQIGSRIYCEKLAEMSDAHPEWAEEAEAE